MTCWEDYLNYYVYLDVVPFKKALMNLLKYFHEKNVDLFKAHCSLSSAAVNMLFQSVKNANIENSFLFLNEENYNHIRRTVHGGLVICSQRLFDCSEGMLIKEYKYGPLALPGSTIIDFDFNNLYGGKMGAMNHLTGPYVQRDLKDNYSFKWCYEIDDNIKNKGCLMWLTFVSLNYQIKYNKTLFIQSLYNLGEKCYWTKNGKKDRVDGYVKKQPHNNRTLILEYLGVITKNRFFSVLISHNFSVFITHTLAINV